MSVQNGYVLLLAFAGPGGPGTAWELHRTLEEARASLANHRKAAAPFDQFPWLGPRLVQHLILSTEYYEG